MATATVGYTPGPWSVEIGDTFGSYIVREVRRAQDSSRDVANAYLIQAAPELWHALQAMVNEYETLALRHGESMDCDAYIVAAVALNHASGNFLSGS
jgi:hypothetical protein